MNESVEMAKTAYEALADKKGQQIVVIDISKISVLGDYFVITNGNSDSQIDALIENLEEKMDQAGYPLQMSEGREGHDWVLLDYGDVIVHIFDAKSREFYDLERIWSDGEKVDFSGEDDPS